MTFKEITIHCYKLRFLVEYAKNRKVEKALLLPPNVHGGCPQPRGSGDAIVPEWARRNLVTLGHTYCSN